MNRLLIVLLFLGSSLPALAVQKLGTETHGGHTIPINGEEWLRDLVDKTTCEWLSGESFAKKTAGFRELTDTVQSSHWYFGQLLQDEVRNVRICMTHGELTPVPSSANHIFAPYVVDGHQVAMRARIQGTSMDTVFITHLYYDKMPVDQRPYLFLHELSHGLIPVDLPLRDQRLPSFVSSVQKMGNTPISREDFELLIDATGIDLAITDRMIPYWIKKEDADSLKTLLKFYPENFDIDLMTQIVASKKINLVPALVTSDLIDFSTVRTQLPDAPKGWWFKQSVGIPVIFSNNAGLVGSEITDGRSEGNLITYGFLLALLQASKGEPSTKVQNDALKMAIALLNAAGEIPMNEPLRLNDVNHSYDRHTHAVPLYPLNLAVRLGFHEVATHLILKNAADPGIRDNSGQSAFEFLTQIKKKDRTQKDIDLLKLMTQRQRSSVNKK